MTRNGYYSIGFEPIFGVVFIYNWFKTLTGVAIGAGWQGYVAYVNLACYYLVGIPIGVILGYVVGLQVKVSFSVYIFFFYVEK